MERKHKIIIISLVIVIVALAAGLAYMLLGNGFSGGESVPEGMQRYDFDSRFTMVVPDDVKFLKEWDRDTEFNFGQGTSYFDKSHKIGIVYANSPIITDALVNYVIDYGNESSNTTIEYDGDLIIAHNIKNNGKMAKTLDKSNFKYAIFSQKNHEIIIIQGNDLDLIKTMANSIKFYSDGD